MAGVGSASARRVRGWPLSAGWDNVERGVRRPFPRQTTLHGQVAYWAAHTPHAPAITVGSEALSYFDLEGRARHLAQELVELGVAPGDVVAVLDVLSVRRVVAYLAILMAGGAYLPLDPANPLPRNRAMVDDCGADIVLVGAEVVGLAPNSVNIETLELRASRRTTEAHVLPRVSALDIAYVMFTSGSSGAPKGIAVPHRAITRLVVNSDYVRLDRHEVVGHGSNASFDAATFEIWGALLNGAKLVGMGIDTMLVHQELTRFVHENSISTLFLTPAVFHSHASEAPGALSELDNLLVGGDVLDSGAVRDVLVAGGPKRLLNMYGPTEATTFSTGMLLDLTNSCVDTLSIGRPIANTDACVLGPDGRVPPGEPGELCIGGDGLARNYIGNPILTAQRFIVDPQRPGQRLYRTGDTAAWDDDGTLVFAGRTDSQVKVRGFRVELGEVEAVLRTHASVVDACAFVHCERGTERLVAYVSGVPANYESYLAERLPPYMIPSHVLCRPTLPLTPNGKVDRKWLNDAFGEWLGLSR